MPALDAAFFQSLPKVLLHDHLDGGLRPATMLELADAAGHALPADDPDALAEWCISAANSGSLARYLTVFDHTTACMQTADALERIAREWVIDLAADGIIAAEARWAPEQHTSAGLSLDEAVGAVGAGLRAGIAEVTAAGGTFLAHQIVTAMRHADRGREIAELAVRHVDDLVCGFDIAGGEAGNPPTRHIEAFRYLRAHDFYYTIHAGEEGELSSMREAVHECGAMRIGHGIKVAENVTADGRLGSFARFVRNQRIPLEVCPTSNVQTGAAADIASHPIDRLMRAGFTVTINTDNRLLGGTTLSREFALVAEAFGWSAMQCAQVAMAAPAALFCEFDERERIQAAMIPAWMQASVG